MTPPLCLGIKSILLFATICSHQGPGFGYSHSAAILSCAGTLTITARGLADGRPSTGMDNTPLAGEIPSCILPAPYGMGRGTQGATPHHSETDAILSHNLEHDPWVPGFQEMQRLGCMQAGCKLLKTSEHLPHLPVDQVVFFLASKEGLVIQGNQ